MLPTRSNRGWCLTRSGVEVGTPLLTLGDSTGADNGHRSDLYRHRKRQRIRANGSPRVTPGVTTHLDQKIRRAVDDCRLIAKSVGREDESNQLRDLFDVVETGGGLHLRE